MVLSKVSRGGVRFSLGFGWSSWLARTFHSKAICEEYYKHRISKKRTLDSKMFVVGQLIKNKFRWASALLHYFNNSKKKFFWTRGNQTKDILTKSSATWPCCQGWVCSIVYSMARLSLEISVSGGLCQSQSTSTILKMASKTKKRRWLDENRRLRRNVDDDDAAGFFKKGFGVAKTKINKSGFMKTFILSCFGLAL